MVRLEAVVDSWKAARADTAQAVDDFPADLDFRPAPDMMSFREIARHILDAGEALAGTLLDGLENYAEPGVRERFPKYFPPLAADAGPAALAAGLRGVLDRRAGELLARPPEFWSHIITRLDGQKVTRLEMLQFAKEHELTHRAQMFVYLRLNGVVPPTTRRRQAAKK
jgi:uncharacterized damage-inducible protein DinB